MIVDINFDTVATDGDGSSVFEYLWPGPGPLIVVGMGCAYVAGATVANRWVSAFCRRPSPAAEVWRYTADPVTANESVSIYFGPGATKDLSATTGASFHPIVVNIGQLGSTILYPNDQLFLSVLQSALTAGDVAAGWFRGIMPESPDALRFYGLV